MCPACVAGVIFMAQIFAVWRWIQRVIFRKPIRDDEDYWNPKSLLNSKMQAFAADKKKVTLLFLIIVLEIIVAIVILKSGGFMFLKHLLMKLK